MSVMNTIIKDKVEQAYDRIEEDRNTLKDGVENKTQEEYIQSLSFQLEHKESTRDILSKTGYYILALIGGVLVLFAMFYSKPLVSHLLYGTPIQYSAFPVYASIALLTVTVITWIALLLQSFTSMPRVERGSFINGKKTYYYTEITELRECTMHTMKVYTANGVICKLNMMSKNMNLLLDWCKTCGIPIKWDDNATAKTRRNSENIGAILAFVLFVGICTYMIVFRYHFFNR